MTKDITTTQQAMQLLQTGIDPLTCNMLEYQGKLIQRADNKPSESIPFRDKDNMVAHLCDFPNKSFEDQKEFMERFQVIPLWTSCALVDAIPDSANQSISLTRGGYDMSRVSYPDDEGYDSDVYFALYEYEDETRDIYIDRTFGGDSYIEAATSMVIAYLTEIRSQIE